MRFPVIKTARWLQKSSGCQNDSRKDWYYKRFKTADTAGPYFELMYLPFEEGADVPRFREQVKNPQIDKRGFVLYHTEQCPFAVTSYCLFYDAKFLTNEILSEKKFEKIAKRRA